MLWIHGRAPDEQSEPVDGFTYFLAYKLRKTIAEVEGMPHSEYVGWAAYFTAKHAVENRRPVTT